MADNALNENKELSSAEAVDEAEKAVDKAVSEPEASPSKEKEKKKPAAKEKAAKEPKNKSKSLQKQKAKMGWLFISPFLVGFVLFYLPMIFDSIQYSFSKVVNSVGGMQLEWVGFENYQNALLKDTSFTDLLFGSLGSLLLNVPAIVIFSLFMAVLLNQKMRGRAIFRAIFFIPVIVSTGIIEYIDEGSKALTNNMQEMSNNSSQLGGESAGQQIITAVDLRRLFSNFAIGQDLINRITGIISDVYGIVSKSGVQMLIFLSGLQSISPAIYESCYIDGASSWETFWKITFPMISPMILVNAIYTIIDSFTSQSNSLMSYISSVYTGSSGGREKATAMAWIYFLVVIAVIAVIAGIIKAYVFYQRKDS